MPFPPPLLICIHGMGHCFTLIFCVHRISRDLFCASAFLSARRWREGVLMMIFEDEGTILAREF